MAHVPPRQRESGWPRHSPVALRASALLWAFAGCADLLDVPSHPQLVGDAVQATVGPPSSAPADPPPESSPRVEPMFMPSPLETPIGPLALDTGDTVTTPATDAGTPETNVESPAPDDAALTPGCPSPQRLGPNDRCYAIVETLLSWLDARRSCLSLGNGWDLAVIRDEPVNQFVATLLTSETWIGATDLLLEGAWLWVDAGDIFWTGRERGNAVNGAYVNWSDDEPNNNSNADCARILPEADGTWADLDCTTLLSAVCEGPLP